MQQLAIIGSLPVRLGILDAPAYLELLTATPVIFWYNYLCTVHLPHLRRWSFDGSWKLRNGYPRVAPRTSEAGFLLLILGFALGIIRIRMVCPAADLYRPTAYKRAG
jgi:hypothetical protein